MRAVLFDAAGTLIEPREPVGETYARAARAYGGKGGTPARVEDAFRETLRSMPEMLFPGCTLEKTLELERDWWRRVVRSTFERAGVQIVAADLERCFHGLFAHYARPDAWRLAPGAADVLAEIRRRGLLAGIVSNFDRRLLPILQGIGIGDLLDTVVLPFDAQAAKPDPRIFRFALARLGVEPCEALYVGDDAVQDVGGAEAAGIAALDVAEVSSLRDVLRRIGQ